MPPEERQILPAAAAIKTPYLPNGKFDLEAYDALVEQQIQARTPGSGASFLSLPGHVAAAGVQGQGGSGGNSVTFTTHMIG